MNHRLGDAQWMRLLHTHNEIVRREIGIHGGFEVKTIGDAFMVAFQSAKRGVACAIAIQRAFARQAASPDPIRVRLGLHLGEPVRESDEVYGSHVNVAARVAASSEAGTVLVSSLLRDVVAPSGEFTFEPRPARALKGFAGTHILYAIT